MRGTEETKPDLTERQLQIVLLIARGCSNEEVGERLGISPRTAKAHWGLGGHLPRNRTLPSPFLGNETPQSERILSSDGAPRDIPAVRVSRIHATRLPRGEISQSEIEAGWGLFT
jgi:hypothetical protein